MNTLQTFLKKTVILVKRYQKYEHKQFSIKKLNKLSSVLRTLLHVIRDIPGLSSSELYDILAQLERRSIRKPLFVTLLHVLDNYQRLPNIKMYNVLLQHAIEKESIVEKVLKEDIYKFRLQADQEQKIRNKLYEPILSILRLSDIQTYFLQIINGKLFLCVDENLYEKVIILLSDIDVTVSSRSFIVSL